MKDIVELRNDLDNNRVTSLELFNTSRDMAIR